MISSRNNRFLQRILSADICDTLYFLSFAKCKKTWKFYSLPFGGTVLSPPPYMTRPLCTVLFYHRTFLVISLHFAVICHLNDLVKASSNLKWTKRSFQWFHSISLLNFSLNFPLGCCLYKLCFDSLWITHPNSWTLAKYGHISIKVFSEHFLKANLPCIGWKAGFVS